jgi:hypothetical protein
MRRAAYTLSLTRWLHATDAVCWQKKSTYTYEGPLHLPTTAHLPCFISFRGKIHVGYFLTGHEMFLFQKT